MTEYTDFHTSPQAPPIIFGTMAAFIDGPDGGPWEAVHPATGNGVDPCPAFFPTDDFPPKPEPNGYDLDGCDAADALATAVASFGVTGDKAERLRIWLKNNLTPEGRFIDKAEMDRREAAGIEAERAAHPGKTGGKDLDWDTYGVANGDGSLRQLSDLHQVLGTGFLPIKRGQFEVISEPFFKGGAHREQEPPVPVKILTYDEMLALPEACFVVEGVIVYRGKNVIFGVSNTFKSFHAVDLGCSVSTGRSYHGKAVKKMKVFYAANEGAIGIGRKRIAAWMAYHGIPQAERRNIFLIRDETIIPDEVSRNNLLAGIRLLVEPGEDFFIIFDIHRGTMNAPDKDDDAADAWIKGAEILIKEGGTTLSIAHSPYSDDARARGSSHQWGSWDGRLQSEGDKEKRTSILKVDRFKDHESCGQLGFTLDEQEVEEHPGEFSLVPRLDGTVKPGKTKPKKLPKNADLALSALKYALGEVGAIPPACNHIPADTKCVTVQQWREYSYMRSGADKPDTKLKNFVRGCEYLSADGDGKIVAILGAYAWLI